MVLKEKKPTQRASAGTNSNLHVSRIKQGKKYTKRVKAIIQSEYHKNISKNEYSRKSLEKGVQHLLSLPKINTEGIHVAAKKANTLPSVVYHEYYLRYTHELKQATSKKDFKDLTKKFKLSKDTLLEHKRTLKHAPEYTPNRLNTLIYRDECASNIYNQFKQGKSTKEIVNELVIGTFDTRAWVRGICKHVKDNVTFDEPKKQEFFEFDSANNLKKHDSINSLNKHEEKIRKEKQDFFEILNQIHTDVGVYQNNGKPKSLNAITKESKQNLVSIFGKSRNICSWRTWEKAVEEWAKTEKIIPKPEPQKYDESIHPDKLKMFELLDETDKKIDIFQANGKPKALRTITTESRSWSLANNFKLIRNTFDDWRVWEDAVKEWKKLNKK